MDNKLRNRLILVAAVVAVSSVIGVAAWRSYTDQKAKEAKENECLAYEAQLTTAIIENNVSLVKLKKLGEASKDNPMQFMIIRAEIEETLSETPRLQNKVKDLNIAYATACGDDRRIKWWKENISRLEEQADPEGVLPRTQLPE
jgi:hypothetical protein